jgi:hypothetical protein
MVRGDVLKLSFFSPGAEFRLREFCRSNGEPLVTLAELQRQVMVKPVAIAKVTTFETPGFS